jgi:hypothetical protein
MFIFCCSVVYSMLSFAVGKVGAKGGGITASRRCIIGGGAGGLILLAAVFMAIA